MKIEIIDVIDKNYKEVHILHIYPPNNRKEKNLYRRHNKNHWTHKLGVYGWHRYMDPNMLEEAYQNWLRTQKKSSKSK